MSQDGQPIVSLVLHISIFNFLDTTFIFNGFGLQRNTYTLIKHLLFEVDLEVLWKW